jgi:RNA polymerase sigma-70 factor (ECF subfamily)
MLAVGAEGSTRVMDEVGEPFAEWVRPHLQPMANLASRLAGPADRDDIVQESLARAWRRFSTYQPERGSPRPWLLAIVADQARRARTRRRPGLVLAVAHDITESDVDLEHAISKLSPRQRLAVELFYFVDLPVAEVASVMGCSEGTVKSTLADARGSLRRLVGDDDG